MPTYSSATLGDANEQSWPVQAAGDGRWPTVFFDDATFQFYNIRVTDPTGVTLYEDASVPIIGQVAGEGGPAPVPVDPLALAQRGDVKMIVGSTRPDGWVRLNGGTIGNGSSGASERANAETQKLFELLYPLGDAICLVPGRTGNAVTDFNAGRLLTLPDMRGRAPFGTDVMGGPGSSDRIKATYVDPATLPGGAVPRNTVGTSGGDDEISLTTAQMPPHTHAATGLTHDHTHFLAVPEVAVSSALSATNHLAHYRDSSSGVTELGYALAADPAPTSIPTVGLTSPASTGISGNTASTGGTGTPVAVSAHENMPPFMLWTFVMKM